MTADELIGQYIKLRNYVASENEKHEQRLKPYNDGMVAIEGTITEMMNTLGVTSLKAEGVGTAFRQEWTSVKMADREVFDQFVQEYDGGLEFFTNAVSKEKVKEFMEANTGALPPGIDFTRGYKTVFRKA